MKFVNLTPHEIRLNSGVIIPPSGSIARVTAHYTHVRDLEKVPVYKVVFGEVIGLPDEAVCPLCGEPDIWPSSDRDYCAKCGFDRPEKPFFIVSGLVAQAVKNRGDILVPATGHPEAKRNEQGQIISVPGFIVI